MDKKYFSERRSIRKFSDREVSEEILYGIIEQASKAPTTGNMQLYSVVVTRSEEMKARLAPMHFSQPAFMNAPVILTVCADLYRFTRWCEVSNANVGFDNFLSFLSAFADAVIFAQQLVTVAELEGLGTCYLGTVTYNAPEIAKILELPRQVVPVACLAIGWPDGEGEATERLRARDIIHTEIYRQPTDDEIVEIYKVKEDYEPNRKFATENGKENLAQVFAEVRYPRQMNEDFSKKITDYLHEEGIL